MPHLQAGFGFGRKCLGEMSRRDTCDVVCEDGREDGHSLSCGVTL